MALTSVYLDSWASRDIHVVRGQSSRSLKSDLTFAGGGPSPGGSIPAVTFQPLFKGTLSGDIYSGFGIHVDTKTGVVTVDAGAGPLAKRNFIIEISAVEGTVTVTEVIRVHVHPAVHKFWLSPDRLTVRKLLAPPSETTEYRFAARVQFDDGIVGDVTEGHGVTWEPATNVNSFGKLLIDASNSPGDSVVITGKLPPALGGGTAQSILKIGPPWAGDPAIPKVSPVVGGGWPGIISPEQVPNVLFLGDGFTAGAADQAAFERIVDTQVNYIKNSKVTRPFDLLATSMNFWKAFLPSATNGISVRAEVYTYVDGGKTFARPLPIAKRPPVGGTNWVLENLIYAVGLPLPGDETKSNAALKAEWAQTALSDPAPHLNNDLIDAWKTIAKRGFIEERDSFPGMAYGELPAARLRQGNYFVGLHPDRLGNTGLHTFCSYFTSATGVQLAGGVEIGNLWGGTNPSYHFDNTGLILMISSFPGGRAQNLASYIGLSTKAGDVDLPVSQAAPGLNAYFLLPPPIPAKVSEDQSRTTAHELGHSFGLGDEYIEYTDDYPNPESSLANFANLQTDDDVRMGGKLNSGQIKWNWQRVRKAVVVSGPITAAGGQFLIPVERGGTQFKAGDKVLLRIRKYGAILPKASLLLPDTLPAAHELEIVGTPESALLRVQGAVTMADLAPYKPGSLLFMPTPALPFPVEPGGVAPRYARMVAQNIEKLINSDRALTVLPCVFDDANTQVPILTGVSLPGICFKHKPKIVGLYSGGALYACGIYHPTGSCMMRGSFEEDAEFCAVCRYIMVDLIDPYHHEEIDREYDEVYPLR